MADPATHICYYCKQVKSCDLFTKNRSKKLGINSSCRECDAVRHKQFRIEHPEIVRGCAKSCCCTGKTVYLRRKKRLCLREKARSYYKQNSSEVLKRRDEWRIRCKAKFLEQARRLIANRRARIAGQMVDPITTSFVDAQYSEQGGLCFYCLTALDGKKSNLDHFYPISKGSESDKRHGPRNIVIACRKCNIRKRDLDPFVFLSSFGRIAEPFSGWSIYGN